MTDMTTTGPASAGVFRSLWFAYFCCLAVFALLVACNIIYLAYLDLADELAGHLLFVAEQINFDKEGNFATWLSSSLLLVAGGGSCALALARTPGHPLVSKLLFLMGVGFVVLSMDDVAQVHGYVEDVVAGVDPFADEEELETPESQFETMLGPVFAGMLAILFGAVFLLPLIRIAARRSVGLLIGSLVMVAATSITELIYQRTGCEEDWCYQFSTTFEESFEFAAIFLMIAFFIRELETSPESGTG